MKIGIIGRKGRIELKRSPGDYDVPVVEPPHSKVGATITKIIDALESSHEISVDADTYFFYHPFIGLDSENCPGTVKDLASLVDVIVVVGGDGTLIDVARQVMDFSVPLIGVNQGRLGFITDIPADKAPETISKMLCSRTLRNVFPETRHLLSLNDMTSSLGIALNDVVFNKVGGRMIEFRISIGRKDDRWLAQSVQFAYKARADGLIIATPTGSTAYALSAGGSIINPTARVIQIIPMLPQTIAYAPIIIDDTNFIHFDLVSGHAEAWIDGQGPHPVKVGGRGLTIFRSNKKVTLWHPYTKTVTYDYWETLRQKLNWHLEPGTI